MVSEGGREQVYTCFYVASVHGRFVVFSSTKEFMSEEMNGKKNRLCQAESVLVIRDVVIGIV